MKWFEVAKIRMKELDINQEKLAEHLDMTKGAISHWLNARREPSLDDIAKIMKYLGFREFVVNHDGTISTASGNENVSNLTPYKPGKDYPVLSSVQAGCWAEAIEAYTLDEISEWLESDAHIQGEAFWLKVEGDSMTAPTGQSVPEGMYVLFDTGKDPMNGSLVIAKLTDSNEATFKKLIIDAGQKYLKGLNPAWPMVPVNGNCKIIGVAVEAKMRFL